MVVGSGVVVAAVVVVWAVVVAAVVGFVVSVDVVEMVCGGDVELYNFSKYAYLSSFTFSLT